jgi:hypothetical protein
MLVIESAYGFGDGIFNAPLIEEIAKDRTVIIATQKQCEDAFYNLNKVDCIINIDSLGQGKSFADKYGYEYLQITQHVRFHKIKRYITNHSLIDTPLRISESLGLSIDNRPIFRPTSSELQKTESFANFTKPLIAIETAYKSGQSWVKVSHMREVAKIFSKTHDILWLSNSNEPTDIDGVINMRHLTRRECASALRFCDILFTTCSGFFCAALGLPSTLQPKKIVCGWKDNRKYNIEYKISKEYKWHDDIIWSHNLRHLLLTAQDLSNDSGL